MRQGPFYFSLRQNLYASLLDKTIIILDTQNDNYLSIIDDAANALFFILNNQFVFDTVRNLYYPFATSNYSEEIHSWIIHFIEEQFITRSSAPAKKINRPLKPGGLVGYQWDTKPFSWKPFKQVSFKLLFKAFITLVKIHRIIKKSGIQGVLDLIKVYSKCQKSVPSEQEINEISAAVDAASLLYPKKTFCLAWAATFVFLSSKKGLKCNFVIGVQTNPFYAHAWAQTPTKSVVHDDPQVAEVLSIILKEPSFES